ncbi:CheY-like chemotaxis protein [Sphingomonas sp. BE123]|jgi:CheY-like chemotaxis protein|uniref:hypothetical protein n=1 Tax=Sphingomonas sp. BE123 TaxID=2817842 RepID=UPI0028642CF9|nr:hypothetical protein [Sphingomonas sp. BE123]MDR6850755.1 CheY-like chemotaxis protein [Sphingomonas sp. BE123]
MDPRDFHHAVADDAAAPLAIALVDPDDAARRALHLLLSGQRHRVRSFASAATLAEDPKSADLAWVIVALRPGSDDLAKVRHLRQRGWRGRLAVIVDRAEPAARDAGMVDDDDLVLVHPVAPHAWQIGLTR